MIWTQRARRDLEESVEWLRARSPQAADALYFRLHDAAASLADSPARGRLVPELANFHWRERIVWPFRLIYVVEARQVRIATIRHGARLLGRDDVVRERVAI